MIGFMIGTVSLLGLMALAMGGRHGRWHHGWHGHHAWAHGPHGGHWGGGRWGEGPDGGPWGGGEHRGHGGKWGWQRFEGAARKGLRRHLKLRDEQEDAIAAAVKDIGEALEGLVTSLKDSREDVARAFRGETLDEVRLATVFEGHDEDLKRARRDIVAALKEAHAVLDAEQRAKVADLFESGPTRWV